MKDTLTLAIIGHLVGDYLLQNDWMAMNKKKETLPCTVHCALWTLSVGMFSGWAFDHPFPSPLPIILFMTHFIQDRTQIVLFWMTRVNRQKKFAEPPMAPWSLVVVDNVWHIVTLWAVWRFIA